MNSVTSAPAAPQTPPSMVKAEASKARDQDKKINAAYKDAAAKRTQSQATKDAQSQSAQAISKPTATKGNNVNVAA